MLTILVGGRPLDPKRAASALLPLDTLLVCPYCNGQHVEAKTALTTTQFGPRSDLELKGLVPRMQDRRCLDCGEAWQSVLPPSLYHESNPFQP